MAFTHPENVIIDKPSPTPDAFLLDVRLSGGSKVYINEAGNVGIGTTAPTHALTFPLGSTGIALYDTADQVTNYRRGFIKWAGTFMVGTEKAPGETGRVLDLVGSGVAFRPTGDGVTRTFLFGTAGHFLAYADNTYDIGASAANRPRDLHLARDAVVGGNIAAGASADIALSAGRALFFNGLGGTRKIVDNPQGNCIDIPGHLTVNGGFKSAPHPVSQNGVSIFGSGATAPGLIQSNWNLELLRFQDVNDPSNPPYVYLGLDQDNLLYTFFQYRTDADGGIFGGAETFKRPAPGKPAAWGYGFQPIRYWGKNVRVDEAGQLIARRSIAPVVSFLRPKHVDPTAAVPPDQNPVFVYPDSYNAQNRPFRAGVELGGIGYDPNDETVQIYRSGVNNDGPDLIFKDVNVSGGMRLSQLVRGAVDRLKIATGETGQFTLQANQGLYDFGTVTLPAGLFTSDPKILLTARNSDSAWSVGLTAYNVTATSFGIMGQNNYNGQSIFFIQWMAVGT